MTARQYPAEAEKKRRRRAEKARLRAWTAEASWDIRVGDTPLDSHPMVRCVYTSLCSCAWHSADASASGVTLLLQTAQAPDGHSWQRRWRQNFSRRKSRNKGKAVPVPAHGHSVAVLSVVTYICCVGMQVGSSSGRLAGQAVTRGITRPGATWTQTLIEGELANGVMCCTRSC